MKETRKEWAASESRFRRFSTSTRNQRDNIYSAGSKSYQCLLMRDYFANTTSSSWPKARAQSTWVVSFCGHCREHFNCYFDVRRSLTTANETLPHQLRLYRKISSHVIVNNQQVRWNQLKEKWINKHRNCCCSVCIVSAFFKRNITW